MNSKKLVIYYSRKGYVKRVAEEYAKKLGADMYEIVPTERTKGFLGFMWCGRFGMHRWEMPIKPLEIDVSQYDEVVFCSPIWVFTFCAPMRACASACRAKVRSARYVFVHFSAPMKYDKAAANMDALLGITHKSYESIVCIWGKLLRRKEFLHQISQSAAQ